MGVPSTFVRLSGCNLRCAWCDTPYASWQPEGPTVEVAELLSQLRDAAKHVVVTGGEPMLFDATVDLCRGLKERGHVITIETAGTVYREIDCDLMSISPKLSNSTPSPEAIGEDWVRRHEKTRSSVEALRSLVQKYEHQLKFVVNPESDLDEQLSEILSLLSAIDARADRVLLMAEGTDSETLHRRQRLLVEPCLRHGFRLTPRLHVDLFGNKRGT